MRILVAVLQADGRRVAVLEAGATSLDVVGVDVLVGEFSRAALRLAAPMRAHSSVVLNVDDPDLAGDEARVHHGATHSVVYNAADPTTERFVCEADVTEGARAVGFTLGSPSPGQLGVVEDVLVDRAFVDDPRTAAEAIGTLEDLAPTAAHDVANALAAAALARSFGVSPDAVAEGLRAVRDAR